MKTVVVIGAGFCGTVVAASLLRLALPEPLRVVLLNRSGLMARGVAYGTRTESHVLNVPAGRMGAFPDDEGGFLRFAQRHDARITGASFLPRRLFGDYLERLLTEAAQQPAGGNRFQAMVGDVLRIEPRSDGDCVNVVLSNGEMLLADKVILALGNFSPADPRVAPQHQAFYRSPRYVRDPWRPGALWVAKPDQPVLLIGTGLTMLDIVLDLRELGHRGAIHAISRHGLAPATHRALGHMPDYDHRLGERLDGATRIRPYLREIRREVAAAAAQAVDWRDVVGGLRAATPKLWRQLALPERRRFIRHLRSYWEVHRHRCAPELGALLNTEIEAGTLRLLAGRVVGFEESAAQVKVSVRLRGQATTTELAVSTVINCTGPESDTRSVQEPLIGSLRAAGLLTPDALGLGLQVADNYALINAQGQPSRTLHYVGPFLRSRDWEATAVPELRQHVAQLVQALELQWQPAASAVVPSPPLQSCALEKPRG